MIAVIYIPSGGDGRSGPIVQTIEGSPGVVAATARAVGGAAIEVEHVRADYDVAFEVVDAKVVAR